MEASIVGTVYERNGKYLYQIVYTSITTEKQQITSKLYKSELRAIDACNKKVKELVSIAERYGIKACRVDSGLM